MLVMMGLAACPAVAPRNWEAAQTPHLDRLAREGMLGLMNPVGIGITPGSGPGHLDCSEDHRLEHLVGRGVLEAVGIGLERLLSMLLPEGADARRRRVITDRRGGRMSTKDAAACWSIPYEISNFPVWNRSSSPCGIIALHWFFGGTTFYPSLRDRPAKNGGAAIDRRGFG